MLVAAAFCPDAPVLLPALSRGAAGETAEVRQACDQALRAVCSAGPELLVVTGERAGPGVAAYLLKRVQYTGMVHWCDLGSGAGESAPPAVVESVLTRPERVALLVMGSGSAALSTAAPRFDGIALDSHELQAQERLTRSLATGDAANLAEVLDWAESRGLSVQPAPWRVLEQVGRAMPAPETAELLSDLAPYGVGYLTGYWRWR